MVGAVCCVVAFFVHAGIGYEAWLRGGVMRYEDENNKGTEKGNHDES